MSKNIKFIFENKNLYEKDQALILNSIVFNVGWNQNFSKNYLIHWCK
jgi:hypothetical protein